MKAFLGSFALAFVAFANLAQAEPMLLMAEEDGCYWCERWDEEIAAIYPKTPEGQTVPLVKYDLYGTAPEDVTFKSPVRFTPTFILVDDGIEIDRIEGYPGEDFFWGLLGMMLERSGIAVENTG